MLVLAEVTLIIVVVLRLVIRSCRFYIALWLGEQVLKHPVQVVLALLLPLRFHLLLAHPEVNVDGSAGSEHGGVVHHANRFLCLSDVGVQHVCVLKVLGGVLSYLQ